MTIRLKPIVLVFGLISMTAMADEPFEANTAKINKTDISTKSLANEVNDLKKEIKSLQKELHSTNRVQTKTVMLADNTNYSQPEKKPTKVADNTNEPQPEKKSTKTKKFSPKNFLKIVGNADYLPFDLDVPGEAFVSTGPYVGVPVQYAGSDLIVNTPSINTDLQLLNMRKHIIDQFNLLGNGESFKQPYHSHLLLSGIIESQLSYYNHSGQANAGVNANLAPVPSSNIDVTNVSVDFTALGPSDWILGYLELTYDNNTPNNSPYTSRSQFTVLNSRVYVSKAFVTIGDFEKSPVYTTFGQFYVPFGTYSSVMVTDTLPKDLGRTKARALEVGFSQQQTNGFYGSAYVFRGDAHASAVDRINNGGLNLGFRFSQGPITADFGGGWIRNIADSIGMQLGANFQNLDFFEQIVHPVGAYDVHANFGIGSHIDFLAEYVTASTTFNPNDLSFNGHGAQPSAYDVEASYSFFLFNKPSTIGLGYSKTEEALALGLPLYRYSLVFTTSIFRNTLQSIEFRRDREYAASDFATGAGNTPVVGETGQSDNAVTAQFDYYF